MATLNPNTLVLATFKGKKVRGKVVGKTDVSYLVQIDAADILTLKDLGYPYHTVAVEPKALLLR